MVTELDRLINCRNYLRDNLHVFIEAFVKYYGEEFRGEIEEKFKNSMVIGYYPPDALKRLLFTISQEKSKELKRKIVKRGDNLFSDDELFNYNDFGNKNLMPINKLKNFYDYYKMGPSGRKEKFMEEAIIHIQDFLPSFTKEDYLQTIEEGKIPDKYDYIPTWMKNNISFYTNFSNAEKGYTKLFSEVKELLKKVDPNITLENISEYEDSDNFKKLLEIFDTYKKCEEEYTNFMSKYDNYQKETEENEKLYHNLSKKYYIEYILNNIDLVPEEKRKEVYDYIEKTKKGEYANSDIVNKLFSYSIKGESPIECFSFEAGEIIRQGKNKWKIKQIEENRIKYLESMGIKCDKPYGELITDPKVQNIIPTLGRVEKFIKDKEELVNRFNIEYYSSIDMYKKMREDISKLNLVDKDDGFGVRLYAENSTFVNGNIVERDGVYSIFPLIGICCDCQSDHLDHRIVHELNHLFELSLVRANNKEYQYTCGWETLTSTITDEPEDIDTINFDRDPRKYELFNEIINELIAQDISEGMWKENQHVFNTEERAKIKNGTSYEQTFFLVKDFFNEYKKIIIESRRNGNIDLILNEVGKENFDELNDLFKIFNDNFSGLRIYNLYSNLKDGIENSQTRLYKELMIKRDIILEKMKNYKTQEHTQENVLQ